MLNLNCGRVFPARVGKPGERLLSITLRGTSRLLSAAAIGLVAGLGGCAAPSADRQASWPPRLYAASERMQAVDTGREQRERAIEESGTTVLMDRPYH
jgi:hypothetical protein